MSEHEAMNSPAVSVGLRGEPMKLPVVLLICSCASVFGFCGAGAANLGAQTKQAPASSKLTTSLSMHGNQFTVGQSVMVTLTIKNISNQSIPFRSITGMPHYYHVYVESTNGEAEKTRFHHRLRGEFLPGESELREGGVTLEIEPGKSEAMDFDLAKYYKLQESGKYHAYVEYDDESGTWVRSNTVSFELKEPN